MKLSLGNGNTLQSQMFQMFYLYLLIYFFIQQPLLPNNKIWTLSPLNAEAYCKNLIVLYTDNNLITDNNLW